MMFLNADLTCDNVSSCELCYNFNSILNVFHMKLNLMAFQKTIQEIKSKCSSLETASKWNLQTIC